MKGVSVQDAPGWNVDAAGSALDALATDAAAARASGYLVGTHSHTGARPKRGQRGRAVAGAKYAARA